MKQSARALRLFALLLAPLAGGAPAVQAQATTDWSWLKNTIWIVPPAGLPSFLFNSSTNVLVPAVDQTVYNITGYQAGYFWGKTVTQVGKLPVSCSSLIGSVTPDGALLLTFVTVQNGVAQQQQGFGKMTMRNGAWTMLNQTSTPNFLHWAYMVQTKPTHWTWNWLPGVGIPVQQFLAKCPGEGPKLGAN